MCSRKRVIKRGDDVEDELGEKSENKGKEVRV